MTKEESYMWMAVGVADHYARTEDCRVYFGKAMGVIEMIKRFNPDISTLGAFNALMETIDKRTKKEQD
ncbi:hypothetical protein [Klebsiella aerogenes]|uniref:hypothetical protein n=1 Tax=Klebsiella aerogenes TaxID=548 RepID=UPI0037A2C51B